MVEHNTVPTDKGVSSRFSKGLRQVQENASLCSTIYLRSAR